MNIQHDCTTYRCSATEQVALRQEREVTAQARATIRHNDNKVYVVNLHAIHNRDHLKLAVPRTMQIIQSPFEDRNQLYTDAAASLRNQNFQKKLAKEATARKQAEDALRIMSKHGGHCTVLLGEAADEESLDDSGEARSTADPLRSQASTSGSRDVDIGDRLSNGSAIQFAPRTTHAARSMPAPSTQAKMLPIGVASTSQHQVPIEAMRPMSAPRGPRQRRLIDPSGSMPLEKPAASSGLSQARRVDELRLSTDLPTASGSLPADNVNALTSRATKRKRVPTRDNNAELELQRVLQQSLR